MGEVVKALKKQRVEQGKQRLRIGEKWRPIDIEEAKDLVFTTATGTPFSERNINRTISCIVKEINTEEEKRVIGKDIKPFIFKDFTPHATRNPNFYEIQTF